MRRPGLPLLIGLAVGVRLLWLLVHPQTALIALDSQWYFQTAANLYHGRGYLSPAPGLFNIPPGQPTAFFPVGYPLFLASVFVFGGGPSVLAGQIANALLGGIAAGAGYVIAHDLFGERAARIAGLLLALYPEHVLYTSLLLTEPLYVALLLAALACLLRRRWITAGLLFGAATLVKGQTAALPALLLVALAWAERDRLRTLVRPAVLVHVALLAVVLPWTIRNTLTFEQVVFVSTNDSYNLLLGSSPYATDADKHPPALEARLDISSEIAYRDSAQRLALDYWRDDPLRAIAHMPLKMAQAWDGEQDAQWLVLGRTTRRWVERITDGVYWVALALGVAGVIVTRRQRRTRIALVPIAFFTALCGLFFGIPRFHAPAMPFVLMFGAAALAVLARTPQARVDGANREPL